MESPNNDYRLYKELLTGNWNDEGLNNKRTLKSIEIAT